MDRISPAERAGLARLLEERDGDGTTLFNRLKRPAQGPSWSHFKNLTKRLEEGWAIEPEDLAHISPYLTEHINRFGEYSTHELGIQPEAYDPKPDVDFAPLREADPAAAGFGQAA